MSFFLLSTLIKAFNTTVKNTISESHKEAYFGFWTLIGEEHDNNSDHVSTSDFISPESVQRSIPRIVFFKIFQILVLKNIL